MPIHPPPNRRFGRGLLGIRVKFPHCPSDQYSVQMAQRRVERRFVKAAVIVYPAPDDRTNSLDKSSRDLSLRRCIFYRRAFRLINLPALLLMRVAPRFIRKCTLRNYAFGGLV